MLFLAPWFPGLRYRDRFSGRPSSCCKFCFHNSEGEVGLCGISLGGFIAGLTAGIDGRYKKAILLLAGGDLEHLLNHGKNETARVRKQLDLAGYGSTRQIKDFLKAIDPLTFAHRLKSCDMLLLNVKNDDVIPPECPRRLVEKAGGKTIKWYPGRSHAAMLPRIYNVLKTIIRHFRH